MASFSTYPSVTFWVVEAGDDELPVGAIACWSPLNGAVPTGWAECDGVSNAPGPDLRNRFVVGRGSTHVVDNTGGSATAILNHTHPVTDPGHDHVTQRYPTTTGGLSGFTFDTSMSGTPAANTLTVQGRVTGVTTNNPAGGLASVEPPWYALIYIQRMT